MLEGEPDKRGPNAEKKKKIWFLEENMMLSFTIVPCLIMVYNMKSQKNASKFEFTVAISQRYERFCKYI